MDYRITQDRGGITDNDILNLIHDSFLEHSKQGMSFTCSNYSIDHVHKLLSDSIILYAVSESGSLLGMTAFHEVSDGKYYEDITCISPVAKGIGIGTALYKCRKKFLIEESAVCLISDTAVHAKSSVNWHIRKCGCRVVGFYSFPSTNYYSYIFREDFVKRSFFVTRIVYPLLFACQYLRCVLLKKKDGTDTWIARILKKIF